MSADAWEALRHITLDRFVTSVKLNGSVGTVNGFTTPEGYPFIIAVAVASPGNERGVEGLQEFELQMEELARWTQKAKREGA